MKRKVLLITLLLLLLFVQAVQAMESENYKLDWYTLLNSSGGGPANSAHYASNITIGQTAIGSSHSTNYQVGLGYWYGLIDYFSRIFSINLPLINK